MTKRKTRIKLGEVVMDALVNENPNRNADITEKPIEKGQDASDHMKQKPTIVKLSGHIVDDSPAKLELLNKYQEEAELLKYVGRNIFTDVVIKTIDTKHNADNVTGFSYDITLQHVSIAVPETFEVKVKDPDTKKSDGKTKSKVKKTTNAGRQQVQSTNPDKPSQQTISQAKKSTDNMQGMGMSDMLGMTKKGAVPSQSSYNALQNIKGTWDKGYYDDGGSGRGSSGSW